MRVGVAEECVARATSTDAAGFGAADAGGKHGSEVFERADSQYRLLFESNPIPMWVFHRETLRFLAVNHAAMRQYGYSEREFLGMTIVDIRPAETVADLMQNIAQPHRGLQLPALW